MMRSFLVIATCMLSVSPALAIPLVGIHWGSCPYPQGDPTNRNPDGSTHQTITVAVRGLSGVVRGIGISIGLKAQECGVGDAWRFDEGGCNRGHVAYNQVPPSDPCPLLTGGNEHSYTGAEYRAEIDPSGYFSAGERLDAYRVFDAFTANPDVTYTLARFDLDLGTDCGCVERRMCIALASHAYIDGDGAEQNIMVDREVLTWNDSYGFACGVVDCFPPGCGPSGADTTCAGSPTPAHTRSWGSVKASYR